MPHRDQYWLKLALLNSYQNQMLAHRRNDHLGHRDGVHIHMAHDRILRNQKPECHNFLDNVVRKYRDNTLLDAKHEYQNGTLRERS